MNHETPIIASEFAPAASKGQRMSPDVEALKESLRQGSREFHVVALLELRSACWPAPLEQGRVEQGDRPVLRIDLVCHAVKRFVDRAAPLVERHIFNEKLAHPLSELRPLVVRVQHRIQHLIAFSFVHDLPSLFGLVATRVGKAIRVARCVTRIAAPQAVTS